MSHSDKIVDIDLGKCVDITAVEGLLEEIDQVKNEGHIRLLAVDVEKIDTAGFQLIACLKQYAQNHHATVEWFEPSEACVKASEMLGFNDFLDIS